MRERLLDAAEALVQARGLDAVSFRDLAAQVGLSKASVFHHFANRDALVQALIERCRVDYGAHYDEIFAAQNTAPDKLRAVIDLFAGSTENGRICLLSAVGSSVATMTDAAQRELSVSAALTIQRFARVFEEGRAEGTLTFDGTPEQAATAFLGMLQGLQILTRARGDARAFADAATVGLQAFIA